MEPTPAPKQPTATSEASPVPTSEEPTPTPRPYRLQPGDLLLAADEDAIPAILPDPSLYVSAEQGDSEWDDREPVIGVEINGQSRAYPIRLLSNHEIVNDKVGGEPIAVTWCPLCYTAITFSRVVDGRELTFGVSGYLFNSNLVMYDHQTNTLWSQILGQSLRGAYRQQFLELVPSRLASWGDWKELHADTTVLSAEQLGKRADQVVDPYTGYYNSGAVGLAEANVDERLPAKSLVVGLAFGDQSVAYPIEEVKKAGIIQHRLDGQPIMIVYLQSLDSIVAYQREVNQRTLSFHDQGLSSPFAEDVQTQSRWDLAAGLAVDGPLEGERLEEIHAPLVFWFAWSAMRPETNIYPSVSD